MTDTMIRILNLPIAAQRVIAAFLVCMIFILVISVLWAAFGTLDLQSRDILESRQTLGRLEQLIALDSGGPIELQTTGSSVEFLSGESEAVVQAALQDNLNSIATTTGASVLSAGGIQAFEKDGVKYVGVRANLQGTLPAIHKLLVHLETGKPYVTIQEITVRGINGNANGRLVAPVELSVQLSFFGALDPAEKLQMDGVRP